LEPWTFTADQDVTSVLDQLQQHREPEQQTIHKKHPTTVTQEPAVVLAQQLSAADHAPSEQPQHPQQQQQEWQEQKQQQWQEQKQQRQQQHEGMTVSQRAPMKLSFEQNILSADMYSNMNPSNSDHIPLSSTNSNGTSNTVPSSAGQVGCFFASKSAMLQSLQIKQRQLLVEHHAKQASIKARYR
jgi:hypothetical protein